VTHGGFFSAFSMQPFTGVVNLASTLLVHSGSTATPLPSAFSKQPRAPVALPLPHLIFAAEHFPVGGPLAAWALTVHSRSAAADTTPSIEKFFFMLRPPRDFVLSDSSTD